MRRKLDARLIGARKIASIVGHTVGMGTNNCGILTPFHGPFGPDRANRA